MTSRIAFGVLLIMPAIASAQMVPAIYSFSGMRTTAAHFGLEADGPRAARPRYEAAALRGSPALETFPGLRLPNSPNTTATRDLPLFKRVRPEFRLGELDIPVADVQDLVFFTETRVVRVRLNLKVAGEPLRETWKKQLRRFFDFLDRDGDGHLNAYEAEFVFSNNSVQQMLQSGNAFNRPNEAGRTLADFDRDGDGTISFDEFIAYYSPSALSLLRVQQNFNRDQFAEGMTEELFKLLDADGNGKLSKAELADFERLLPILDQNEDECLAALEIVPNLLTRPRPVMVVNNPPRGPAPVTAVSQPLQVYRVGFVPETIAEQIILRYDKDKNLRLNKAESGFDDALFAKLDRNNDGELSIVELMAWRFLAPDLSFELTFSTKQSECVAKLLPDADGQTAALAGSVKIGDDGKAFVRIGQQTLELGSVASLGVTFNQARNLRFEQADLGNKGYITESDITAPQYQDLRILFDVVDRDGDGKMTKKEYLDYFELQQSFFGLPLGLSYVTQTPSLFSMIDANADGRLSLREMRQAWDRLKHLEPGGGEFITKTALQPQATIRFTRATQMFQPIGNINYNPTVQPTTLGPVWFRKMDRNGDGDISRSEFPGSMEEFAKLDTNKDGLISLEEAEEADKRLRVEKK